MYLQHFAWFFKAGRSTHFRSSEYQIGDIIGSMLIDLAHYEMQRTHENVCVESEEQ